MDQEYAALSGLYKPFLHTWSLSVEEQYYIFFPLFFNIQILKKIYFNYFNYFSYLKFIFEPNMVVKILVR